MLKKIFEFIRRCTKPSCSLCGSSDLTLCNIEYNHLQYNPDGTVCDKSKKYYECNDCGASLIIL